MNYLTLCQSAHRKLRGGNAEPGTKPSAIPAASTDDQMVKDIVDAVPTAWENLQNLHPSWRWMRKQATLPLVLGQRTYTLAQIRATITDYDWLVTFDAGAPPYLNLYDGTAPTRTDNPLWVWAYENWRGYKDRQPLPGNGMPSCLTERPDYTLEFDRPPNLAPSGGPWTLVLDYRKTNQTLVAQADIPELPPKYHELIVWMAVQLVCEMRNSTGYLMQLAQREIDQRMAQVQQTQLPVLLIDTRYG